MKREIQSALARFSWGAEDRDRPQIGSGFGLNSRRWFNRAVDRSASGLGDETSPARPEKFNRSRVSRQQRQAQFVELNQQAKGRLSRGDRRNQLRHNSFADDYLLLKVERRQRIQIEVRSQQFDTFLQVFRNDGRKPFRQNDDAAFGTTNSSITFTANPSKTYRIRVTSYGEKETGRYRLITSSAVFDSDSGYGLVDAAAAIARILGRPALPEVPDLGGDNWNLDMVKAPEAWAQGFTGQGVIVAVLDTGVDYNHPDLAQNIWTNTKEIPGNGIDDDRNGFIDDIRGWNFVDGGSNDPMDTEDHGTHVSGVIAAANNGFGVTGVAYNAKIMPLRVIGGNDDNFPARFDANLAEGIRYAVQNGAKVLNMSLGNFPGDPTMVQTRAALEFARRAGVVAVMAAGNERQEGETQPIEPAIFSRNNLGIAVGAINNRYQVANFSTPAGDRPLDYLVAPGVNVTSTIPNERYEGWGWSGTSMATPHIAGVVALMLSANPGLTPDQIERSLIQTANSNVF